MKKTSWLILMIPLLEITSCNKSKENSNNNIYYASVNKQYVFTRNIDSLTFKTDEVSVHLDSIISGKINSQVISTGFKSFDLTGDKIKDLSFEIIDLGKYNFNKLPVSFDTLAVRVVPSMIQVLDNSTFNYADGLNIDYSINNTGNWTNETCVLGTFANAGQFNGKGEKYLGIRIMKDKSFMYGWIKLYCSAHNDTLRIIEYAYNKQPDKEIKSGQKE